MLYSFFSLQKTTFFFSFFLLLLPSFVFSQVENEVESLEDSAAKITVDSSDSSSDPTNELRGLAKITSRLSDDVSINLPPTIILKEFIKIISTQTGTVFLYQDNNLRGQMSITAPPNLKISAKDAFYFFEKILQTQGLTLVPRADSNIIEILPASEARFSKLPISSNEPVNPETEFMMRLIRLQHGDIKRIQATLQPIFSKAGIMLVYDPLQILILLDNAANIQRIEEIIAALDIAEPEGVRQEIVHFKAKNGNIKEIHQTISNLFANLMRSGKQLTFRFVLEERFNSMFIVGTPDINQEILDFAEKLDTPVEGKTIIIHELQYSNPQKLIPLLNSVYPQTESLRLIPFEDLNALVILSNPTTSESIISLVNQLDVNRSSDTDITIHRLEYASANVLGPLLSRIFSDQIVEGKDQGQAAPSSKVKIIAEPRINGLIILADQFSTNRVIELAGELDIPQGITSDLKVELIRLQYTTAQNMAELLTRVFADLIVAGQDKGKAAPQSKIKIIAEPRLNGLIVIGDREKYLQVTTLLKKLDVFQEKERIPRNFKLYRLQHAIASEIAKLLREVTGQITEVSTNDQETNKKTADNKETTKQQGEISISADDTTNSLLVFAPTGTFETIDEIIQNLDVSRLQVYVEALIIEATLNKSLDLGVEWKAIGTNTGNEGIATGFPNSTPATAESLTSAAGKSVFGIVNNNSISFGGKKFFSFSAFVRATKTNSDLNVLANPQMLMLNNEEATINVSRNTPVSPKTVTDAKGVVTTEFEFKDVGIILTIKPQISGEDSIRLDINQESSTVVEGTVSKDSAVTTFKRQLKTAVVTRNEEIVVLGGLINEDTSSSGTRIPGLSDLPLLGALFSESSDKLEKTNLLLFIRPKIIRTQQDLIEITKNARERYESYRKEGISEQVLEHLNIE